MGVVDITDANANVDQADTDTNAFIFFLMASVHPPTLTYF
jgi:hypothetical protein